MWCSGDDTNEQGTPVRLYQPIPSSKGRLTNAIQSGAKQLQDLQDISFIGGDPSWVSNTTRACPQCQQSQFLLLQLVVDTHPKRIYQVFACNRASCYAGLFEKNHSFSSGGNGGVMTCVRLEAKPRENVQTPLKPNAWGTEHSTEDSNNEWMVDDRPSHDDATADALEQMITNLEVSKPPAAASHKPKSTKSSNYFGFSSWELQALSEPVLRRNRQHDEEEDDAVGMHIRDEKIQNMLARYMAEEEDEEILAALRGNTAASGGGTGKGERDERLAPDEQAFLTFSDRLKRAPRQVLRYAPGGIPIWSVPISKPKNSKQRQGRLKQEDSGGLEDPSTEEIPNCQICGSQRVFEFQILPSLLHVLQVDQQAITSSSHKAAKKDVCQEYQEGGMNWGSVAVYACPKCPGGGECLEYLVIQDSVDGAPQKREIAPSMDGVVVSAQDDFCDDDDDDDILKWEDQGSGDDDDDDDEGWQPDG